MCGDLKARTNEDNVVVLLLLFLSANVRINGDDDEFFLDRSSQDSRSDLAKKFI